MKYIYFLLFLFLSISAQSQVLSLEIIDIKSDKGTILLSLYNGEKGFPYQNTSSIKQFVVQPNQGKVTLVVKDLPPGEYAFALFHDVDGNGKLSTNFLGIPKEGYAFSNNAFNRFGVPKYKDASFLLRSDVSQKITLRYF